MDKFDLELTLQELQLVDELMLQSTSHGFKVISVTTHLGIVLKFSTKKTLLRAAKMEIPELCFPGHCLSTTHRTAILSSVYSPSVIMEQVATRLSVILEEEKAILLLISCI